MTILSRTGHKLDVIVIVLPNNIIQNNYYPMYEGLFYGNYIKGATIAYNL